MRENVTRDQRRVLRADHLALGPYGIWAVLFILVPRSLSPTMPLRT